MTAAHGVDDRDWQAIEDDLGAHGCAVLDGLMPPDDCVAIAARPPRKTYFWTLPVAVLCNSSTKVIHWGVLKCARRS